MALHWFCICICVDIVKAKNQKWQMKTNIWKSLNNFVTIVHWSSKSRSNFALPAAFYLPRSLPLAKPNIIRGLLNQAAWIITTASSYFMIFWYWLSFSSSDNSDLWVAVKLVEISGQLLGRKMNIYGANSSFQIYWLTLACYQDSSPTWRLCRRQKQRLWAIWEWWPGWTLDFHWS